MLEQAFEPSFLKRLDNLALGIRRARTVRLGRRALGRVRGAGLEVESFKDYAEGDDLRYLDWNAMARLDSLLIRSYKVERETEVTIMIDASASMGMPASDHKFDLARILAAALAYIGLGENDPVRLMSFAAYRGRPIYRLTDFVRRTESYHGLRPMLTEIQAGGQTTLSEAVMHLLNQRRPAGVVIVISDFLYDRELYATALSRLMTARYEVKAIQVLGAREAAIQLSPGAYRLRDCESGQIRELTLTPAAVEACRRRLARLREELQEFCKQHEIYYAAAIGADCYDDFLTKELPRLGLVQ
jgi:uncharacterized protein (DUF58 family)